MFGLTPINRNNAVETRRQRNLGDVDTWFDSFFRDAFQPSIFGFNNQMKVDIKSDDANYIIEADLPGVDKKDIQIELRNDVLTIGVQRNEETNEEKDNYIYRERRSSSLCRSFRVENVQPEDVKASYENGVLSITLPKREAEDQKQYNVNIN